MGVDPWVDRGHVPYFLKWRGRPVFCPPTFLGVDIVCNAQHWLHLHRYIAVFVCLLLLTTRFGFYSAATFSSVSAMWLKFPFVVCKNIAIIIMGDTDNRQDSSRNVAWSDSAKTVTIGLFVRNLETMSVWLLISVCQTVRRCIFFVRRRTVLSEELLILTVTPCIGVHCSNFHEI